MTTPNYDFLEKCTKEELIYCIRQAGWIRQAFRYSDVLSARWKKESDKMLEKQKAHHEKLQSLDGKAQDILAHQFNAENDFTKKLEIAEKMKPYNDKMAKWWKEEKMLQKEEAKINALYESIDIQRKKEIS
jgi:hypothetical protein